MNTNHKVAINGARSGRDELSRLGNLADFIVQLGKRIHICVPETHHIGQGNQARNGDSVITHDGNAANLRSELVQAVYKLCRTRLGFIGVLFGKVFVSSRVCFRCYKLIISTEEVEPKAVLTASNCFWRLCLLISFIALWPVFS